MAEVLIDSYSESNVNIYYATDSDPGDGTEEAQSFTGNGTTLTKVKFYMRYGAGTPTGNYVVKIYAHSGTFGTSSVPTGTALATSDGVLASSIPVSATLIEFTFTGSNRIDLVNGTKYVVSLDGSAVGNASNYCAVGADTSSPSHAGNRSWKSGAFAATSGQDMAFYVYGEETATVDTDAASAIGSTRATLSGEIINVGLGGIDTRGFVFGTSPGVNPGNVAPASSGYPDSVSESGSFTLGTYSLMATGLDSQAIHYFRAYVHNTGGYDYGDELSLETLNLTTVTLNNTDPTDMFKTAIDSANTQGSEVSYDLTSTDNTGLLLDYTFRLATALEGVKVAYNLAPSGWYWYIDLGTNIAYFKNTASTATHKLIKGRHLANLKLRMSIQNVKNKVYFTGGDIGGGVNLFSYYSDDASIAEYGPRIDRRTDNRVTVQTTANAYGQGVIGTSKDEAYYTEVDVLDGTYDITLFKPGDTVGFRGFGNFIESLILQIVRIDYTPQKAKLYLGTIPPRQSSTIEQVRRDLLSVQTVNNPSEPS